MKFQTLTALSLLLCSTAPVAFAAATRSEGASASVNSPSQSSLLTVVTGVSGGHTVPSSPLALLKVNGAQTDRIADASVNLRNTPPQPLRAVAAPLSDSSAEPGTLAMLLTGLGVMGSIARRRRLAGKAV